MMKSSMPVKSKKYFFHTWPVFFFLSIFFWTFPASAQEIDESVYSLQSRKYRIQHEFYLAPGILPLDAFKKGVIANMGYTYHFNDGWAVEVPQFAYVRNVDTGLQKDLENLGMVADDIDQNTVKYFGSINVIMKPIYRKMILFNRKIMHGETFFIAGGGPFKVEGQNLKASINFGIGFRFYLNDLISIRFDGRDYIWFRGGNPSNVPMLSLGVSFHSQKK